MCRGLCPFAHPFVSVSGRDHHHMSARHAPPLQNAFAGQVRALTKQDLPLFSAHLLRLDSEARRHRFGRNLSDTEVTSYAAGLPFGRGLTMGCFPDDSLRGVIEARPVGPVRGHWECVISVERDWQRRGLGQALTDIAFPTAKQAGASRIYLRCSTANTRAVGFLSSLVSTLREEDDDVIGLVDLAPAVCSP
jgi:ribosomal protein S18 acetylase RimI-like enzyme